MGPDQGTNARWNPVWSNVSFVHEIVWIIFAADLGRKELRSQVNQLIAETGVSGWENRLVVLEGDDCRKTHTSFIFFGSGWSASWVADPPECVWCSMFMDFYETDAFCSVCFQGEHIAVVICCCAGRWSVFDTIHVWGLRAIS
jgi:hypothetical protein